MTVDGLRRLNRCLWALLLTSPALLGVDQQLERAAPLIFEKGPLHFSLKNCVLQPIVFVLEKGQFVHLHIEQPGVDLSLHFKAPNGTRTSSDTQMIREEGGEELLFTALESGSHVVEIRPREPIHKDVSCKLHAEIRPVGDKDLQKISLFEKLARIRNLEKPGPFIKELLEYGHLNKHAFLRGVALAEWGHHLQKQNQLPEAVTAFQEAIAMFPTDGSGHYPWLVALHYELGSIFQKLETDFGAFREWEKGLEIARKQGFSVWEIRLLRKMGILYHERGRHQTAIGYHNSALNLAVRENRLKLENRSRLSLAMIYGVLGQVDRALDQLPETERLRSSLHRMGRLGAFYMQKAWFFHLKDEYETALNLYDKAFALHRDNDYRQGEAATYDRLGTTLRAMGRYQEALAMYQESLVYWEGQRDPSRAADVLSNIGQTYAALGDWENTTWYCGLALELMEPFHKPGSETRACFFLAKARQRKGDFKEALALMERSLCLVETSRRELNLPSLGRSYTGTRHEYHRFTIDLLMELYLQESDIQYARKAFMLSERNRARFLKRSLQSSRQLTEKEISELRQIGERITELKNIHMNLSSDQKKAVERNLRRLILKQDQYLAEPSNFEEYDLFSPDVIISDLLDEETLLLSYVFSEERTFLWVLAKNRFEAYLLPERLSLETAAEDLSRLLSKRPSNISFGVMEMRSKALARNLLGKIAPILGNYKRLAVITDGNLYHVPFGFLPSPIASEGKARPMILDFEIVRLPSATFGLLHRKMLRERKTAPRQLAVFADPDFGDHERYPQLPQTKYEALSILDMVPKEQRFSALGVKANKSSVFSSNLHQYRLLHFATHFHQDPSNLELSAIVLSLIGEDGTEVDGFLRTTDLASLGLQAECITLSACETGTGVLVPGDSMWGMSSALLSGTGGALTRVLVSTLWPITDKSAAQLMIQFYGHMLKDGLPPTAALRMAQIDLIQSNRWSHPYFWAAFIPYGDWTAEPHSKNSSTF